jgi:hypothetical protein
VPPPDDALTTNDQRIAWVLAHPGTSAWLKDALRAARERDPVEVLNELEILNLLLRELSPKVGDGLIFQAAVAA